MDAEALHRVRAWLTATTQAALAPAPGDAAVLALGGLQALFLAGVLERAETESWMQALGMEATTVRADAAGSGGGASSPTSPPSASAPGFRPPRFVETFEGRSFRRLVPIEWRPNAALVVTSVEIYDDGVIVAGHSTAEGGEFVDVELTDAAGAALSRAAGHSYVIGALSRWEFTFVPESGREVTTAVLSVDGHECEVNLQI
jgi:hypothetical protein